MGYIGNFRAQLEKLIENEQIKEAITFAATECRESYIRGLKAAKAPGAPKQKTRQK